MKEKIIQILLKLESENNSVQEQEMLDNIIDYALNINSNLN